MTQREELLALAEKALLEINDMTTDTRLVDRLVEIEKCATQALEEIATSRAAARPVEPVASRLEQIIEETGSKDAEDLADMANVGHSLMRAINTVVTSEGPFKGWSPAEDPAEIVLDLVNALDEAVATPPPRDWNAAIEAAAKVVESGSGMSDLIEQALLDQQAKYIRALSSPSVAQGAGAKNFDGWHEGAPPKPWADEWFIAETTYGDRVVLRSLPEEYTYDFITADDTYIKADRIKRWMQFPDSEFIVPSPMPGSGGGEA